MTPHERYQADLKQNGFCADAYQSQAVEYTQHLYDDLINAAYAKHNWLPRLLPRRKRGIKGLYFRGEPGRGKTYLVDCFYECLPFVEKNRVHFHRFMRDIHQQLKDLPKSPDPLVIIAKNLARKYRVLCLDEFHVHDIADAMLMAGLLKALFDNGVTLVATSNIAIDDLYKNGLQRERFLYAIELLKQHTLEVDLGDSHDYRLAKLEASKAYDVLSPDEAHATLEAQFNSIAPVKAKHIRKIEINNRLIEYIALADDVIWFDFNALCNTPRSAHDYLEIAQLFHTVFLSNVFQMQEAHDSIAKRFVHLVDALYDHNVKLIIAAAAPAQDLYHGRRQVDAFRRTLSRLHEMGGKEYLARPHLLR